MVRLKNIKIGSKFAEADFFPEDSKISGHVVVDLEMREITDFCDVPGFGDSYRGHTFLKLVKMARENDKRTECIVMWY